MDSKSGYIKQERRYTGHAGMVIPIVESRNQSRVSSLYPNIIYMQQGFTSQLNLGCYISRGQMVGGFYYRQITAGARNPDAFILVLGLRTQKVKIGYSYDATMSQANPGAPQFHEVSLAFELKKRKYKKLLDQLGVLIFKFLVMLSRINKVVILAFITLADAFKQVHKILS
jgi:hypothetical protein